MVRNKDIELMARTRMSSGNRGSGQKWCARVVVPSPDASGGTDGTACFDQMT